MIKIDNLQPLIIPLQNNIQNLVNLAEEAQKSSIPFKDFSKVWDKYYFTEFYQFESFFKKLVEKKTSDWQRLLPSIVSHHNLHRLVEVLSNELGDNPLNKTKIPERYNDLIESFLSIAIELKKLH